MTGSGVDTISIMLTEAVSVVAVVSVVVETVVSVSGKGVKFSAIRDAMPPISPSAPRLAVDALVTTGSGDAVTGSSNGTTVVKVLDVAELTDEDAVNAIVDAEVTVSTTDTAVVTVFGVAELIEVDAVNVEVTVTAGVESEVGSDCTTTTVVVDGVGGVTVMYTVTVSTGSRVGDMVIKAIEAIGSDLVTMGYCVVLAVGSAAGWVEEERALVS